MGFVGGVPAVTILGQPIGVELAGAELLSQAVTSDPFGASFGIADSSTRSVIVVVPFAPTLSPNGPVISVVGGGSGFDYTGPNPLPMQFYDGQRAFWVVPVDPSIDSTLTLNIARTGFSPVTPGSVSAAGSPLDDAPERFRDFAYTQPKGCLSPYVLHVDRRGSGTGGSASLSTGRYIFTSLLVTGISDATGVTAEATLTYDDANQGDGFVQIPIAYAVGPSQTLPVVALHFRDGLHAAETAQVTFNGPGHGLYDCVLMGQAVLF